MEGHNHRPSLPPATDRPLLNWRHSFLGSGKKRGSFVQKCAPNSGSYVKVVTRSSLVNQRRDHDRVLHKVIWDLSRLSAILVDRLACLLLKVPHFIGSNRDCKV